MKNEGKYIKDVTTNVALSEEAKKQIEIDLLLLNKETVKSYLEKSKKEDKILKGCEYVKNIAWILLLLTITATLIVKYII